MTATNGEPAGSNGDYIRGRAERTVLIPSGPQKGFFDYTDEELAGLNDLVNSNPGSEKSRTGTSIANELWEKWGKPTLYLMLTHEAIKDRLRHIEKDGKAEFWQHSRGHDKDCSLRKWAEYGYAGGKCNCNHASGGLNADKPTLAALDVVLEDDVTPWSVRGAVKHFPLWIVDEIDFGRLVDQRSFSEKDLRTLVKYYPSQTNPKEGEPLVLEPARLITKALLQVLDQMKESEQAKLNGPELYRNLDSVLTTDFDSSVEQLATQLRLLQGHLPTGQWATKSHAKGKPQTLQGKPRNFPPFFVPVFCEETDAFLLGKEFNPRIHMLNQEGGTCLRIRWRRQAVDREFYLTGGQRFAFEHLVVLDATADAGLLDRVFPGIKNVHTPALPEWPTNVHVHQWGDSVVSQTELGRDYANESDTLYEASKLEEWFQRIKLALDPLDRKLSVGVITHKALHEQLKERITSLGFESVRSMYYFNLRGSNEFEKRQILVMLGCPIPNYTGFEEECQAFLYDDPDLLDFHRNQKALALGMRDGREYPVQVYGTWNPPASGFYWQKCQAELYQALHRIRPYIPKKFDRDIFLFTNMPVEGVKVEEVITDPADPANENWNVAHMVKEVMKNREEVTVKEIALLVAEEDRKLRSVERRIADNGDAIAILACAWYLHGTPGKGGTANRFAKNPI